MEARDLDRKQRTKNKIADRKALPYLVHPSDPSPRPFLETNPLSLNSLEAKSLEVDVGKKNRKMRCDRP